MAEEGEKDQKRWAIKDWFIAWGIVACLIGVPLLSLFAYSGIWLPMMVVSSGSMTHDDASFGHIGSIETGDVVIPKRAGIDEVVTWEEGKEAGYMTYGDWGDVIIYHKNGDMNQPPVIHRAMVRIDKPKETNVTNIRGYRAQIEVEESQFGDGHFTVFITLWSPSGGLSAYRRSIKNVPLNTLITWGDHNRAPDQISLPAANGGLVRPIQKEWLVGVSRGEMPWMGLLALSIKSIFNPESIKLEDTPRDCWIMFGVVIACIVVALVLSEVLPPYMKRKKDRVA